MNIHTEHLPQIKAQAYIFCELSYHYNPNIQLKTTQKVDLFCQVFFGVNFTKLKVGAVKNTTPEKELFLIKDEVNLDNACDRLSALYPTFYNSYGVFSALPSIKMETAINQQNEEWITMVNQYFYQFNGSVGGKARLYQDKTTPLVIVNDRKMGLKHLKAHYTTEKGLHQLAVVEVDNCEILVELSDVRFPNHNDIYKGDTSILSKQTARHFFKKDYQVTSIFWDNNKGQQIKLPITEEQDLDKHQAADETTDLTHVGYRILNKKDDNESYLHSCSWDIIEYMKKRLLSPKMQKQINIIDGALEESLSKKEIDVILSRIKAKDNLNK